MKTMKLLTLLLLVLPVVLQAQLTFTTNSGVITITGYTGTPTSVVIPNTTNGYSVTSIGSDAFYDCYSLTNVTIPNTVTNIGSQVFYDCTSLTNITVAVGNPAYSSVGGVLFDVSQANLIQFPGGLGGSYVIPNTVTNISSLAFYDCSSLTNVTIGSAVSIIGSYAFENCSSLTSVAIPNSVISVGNYAFNCYGLTNITVAVGNPAYSSMGGVLFDLSQANLIQFPSGLGGSYAIPNTVTNIGSGAFYGCHSLTSVTIPNSVKSIATYAFNDSGLITLTIGSGVSSIGTYAFYFCPKLTSLTLGCPIVGNWFAGLPLTSVTLLNTVTRIGDNAFYNCNSLTTLTIGSGVTSIGSSYAFQNCYNLTSIFFKSNAPSSPNNLTVFQGDNNATVYYLPGTTGWGATFDGRPVVLWNPQAQTSDASFGVRANKFGFNLTGSSNLVIVVEAATNLVNPIWTALATNTLTNGTSYFSDAKWTNFPSRYYRIRSP
jgi:hypothetical protein